MAKFSGQVTIRISGVDIKERRSSHRAWQQRFLGVGVGHGSLLLWGTFSMPALTCWFFLGHVFPGQCVPDGWSQFTAERLSWAWLSTALPGAGGWRGVPSDLWGSAQGWVSLLWDLLDSVCVCLLRAAELENREAGIWHQVDQIFQCLNFSVSIWVICVRKI